MLNTIENLDDDYNYSIMIGKYKHKFAIDTLTPINGECQERHNKLLMMIAKYIDENNIVYNQQTQLLSVNGNIGCFKVGFSINPYDMTSTFNFIDQEDDFDNTIAMAESLGIENPYTLVVILVYMAIETFTHSAYC